MKKELLLVGLTALSVNCRAEEAKEEEHNPTPYEALVGQEEKSKQSENQHQEEVKPEETKEPEKTEEAEEKSIVPPLEDPERAPEEDASEGDDDQEAMTFAEQVLEATEAELETEVETRVIWSLLEEVQKHIEHLDPNLDQEKIVRISQALLEMLEKIKTITVRAPLNFAAWNQLVHNQETNRVQSGNDHEKDEPEQHEDEGNQS